MIKQMWATLGTVAVGMFLVVSVVSGEETDEQRFAAGVDELRNAAGRWSVVTEFLGPDGNVAQEVAGGYTFDWVVEDRVLSGHNHIPDMGQKSAILFYVNEKKMTIEMVAVGADGHLWIMTGPVGADTRYSQEFESSEGKPSQLRFTRFNVSDDRFESRMEYTEDGGKTWTQGNHQVFTRRSAEED